MYGTKTIGKAYGFFDSRTSKSEIEYELPTIRGLVKTPPEVELTLTEDLDNLRSDSDLMDIARDAKSRGIKYLLEGTFPGATNRKTADEIANVLNQAYQSPLFDEGETFRGAIVFEENGKYIFRD